MQQTYQTMILLTWYRLSHWRQDVTHYQISMVPKKYHVGTFLWRTKKVFWKHTRSRLSGLCTSAGDLLRFPPFFLQVSVYLSACLSMRVVNSFIYVFFYIYFYLSFVSFMFLFSQIDLRLKVLFYLTKSQFNPVLFCGVYRLVRL